MVFPNMAYSANSYPFIEGNALVAPFYMPRTPKIEASEVLIPEVVNVISGQISAYTSDPSETDSTPNITASGVETRKGIIANNCLEFGTKVEIAGSEYEVQDRMNERYGCEYFDLWIEDKAEAINYGRRERNVRIYGEWTDHRVFSSCVKTARFLGLNLPGGDAKDLVPNGAPTIGGGIIFKYPTYSHVAVIKEFRKDGYWVAEGNFEKNKLTYRLVSYNEKSIVGFWNEDSSLAQN